ncbi:U6 snRNA phosphodiesterase Usb1 [Macrophomina phaseolina]|uniref:U6 snRNA phosphodiesterase n=1 Tax=Macrophomina phaseolina TaxID=35725 RepID=A0ABQ8GLT4_9PEZI|nr:U6 snRNA phosphodiesterase Usb1 [Macrophomina phaseolina]
MAPLVEYSDSDSEPAPAAKRQRRGPTCRKPSSAPSRSSAASLPPLPAHFHDLYATNARQSTHDDPALHAGRKRAIPHMDGRWPSHVYLEWHPNATESRTLQSLLSRVTHATAHHFHTSPQRTALSTTTTTTSSSAPQHIRSSLLTDLSTPAPLHISLSRTLPLPTDARAPFLDALTKELRHSGARPFDATFEGLRWVPNFDRSRWFLVLGVARPEGDALNRLLRAANRAAGRFGFPELYGGDGGREQGGEGLGGKKEGGRAVSGKDDRSEAFHVSLAWSLEPPPEELRDLAAVEEVGELMEREIAPMTVKFGVVKVKVGNAIHTIDIAPRRKEEKGILGLG